MPTATSTTSIHRLSMAEYRALPAALHSS